jgi:hypothetical protein
MDGIETGSQYLHIQQHHDGRHPIEAVGKEIIDRVIHVTFLYPVNNSSKDCSARAVDCIALTHVAGHRYSI